MASGRSIFRCVRATTAFQSGWKGGYPSKGVYTVELLGAKTEIPDKRTFACRYRAGVSLEQRHDHIGRGFCSTQ